MKALNVAAKLSLPVDVAGEAIGILAKRGAGKTNTAVVLVEEMHRAGVQVVVLDPVGVWWGIRAGHDGSRKGGLPIPVVGGEHGDVALEPTAGELVADVVVDTGQSLVVDVSEFSKTQQRSFVAALATRLYRRKATQRSLLHVVLEEADEFAPQRVTAGDAPMVGAIAQLVKRGRSRGLGLTFVTQRSASLNKDVLDQADVLIAMRTSGPRDRKAIEGWIEHQNADGFDQVLPSLPSLETGEAWVWNPERDLLQLTKIRPRTTFDSSATPKAGEKRAEPKETATIDLAALGKRIEETAERAKQNDPAELRRQIRELERRAAQQHGNSEREHELETEVEELRKIVGDLDTELNQLHVQHDKALGHEQSHKLLCLVLDELHDLYERGLTAMRNLRESDEAALPGPTRPGIGTLPPMPKRPRAEQVERREVARQSVAAVARPPARRPAPPTADTNGKVSGPQQRILDALAGLEAIRVPAPKKVQLALFAQASPKSSSYTNNLGALRTAGLIDYPAGGFVSLTQDGRAIADGSAIPTGADELHQFVYGLVGRPKARLLEALIGAYPGSVSKADLAYLAGASASSSSFTNNLGALRSLGLIDYPAPGYVAALEVLFV